MELGNNLQLSQAFKIGKEVLERVTQRWEQQPDHLPEGHHVVQGGGSPLVGPGPYVTVPGNTRSTFVKSTYGEAIL